jgi:hypothetical protein
MVFVQAMRSDLVVEQNGRYLFASFDKLPATGRRFTPFSAEAW